MSKLAHFSTYLLLRALLFPISFLSYRAIHKLAHFLGRPLFHLHQSFRKRALSNLALAKTLNLSTPEILSIAKGSLVNLLITALEYPKLAKEKNLLSLVHCQNPETAAELLKTKGLIFFCAHQANWELLFLDGTSRMPGIAIGRPIKNPYLYNWVLKIRTRLGGHIIPPQNALKASLKALKSHSIVGIVGDQGMPDSGFSSLFFGRGAYTSPLPAILAYRTGSPLFFAETIRKNGHYIINYSEPLYPNPEKAPTEEIPRLMHAVLDLLEKSITKHPDQWLWQHNRWKQKLPGILKKRFRQDAIAILIPQTNPERYLAEIAAFRTLYPTEWILLMIPKGHTAPPIFDELHFYTDEKELFITHYGPKLVFNFTGNPKLSKHFLKLAAFDVITEKELIPKDTFTQSLLETAHAR